MSGSSLSVRKGATTTRDARAAARELHDAISQGDMRVVLFWCSADYDLDALGAAMAELFRGVEIVGCTSAGEITPNGYLDGSLTGFSIGAPGVTAVTRRLDGLKDFELAAGEAAGRALLDELGARGLSPDATNTFAFLEADGLSMKEEAIVSAVHRALGDIMLFGGSAGDGTRFARTHVFHEGRFREDCAVVALFHTKNPFVVFKTQHFVSSEDKMVVTEADPARRLVSEINGEPAGREYARMVGLEVDALTPLIFAAYPVVVKLGGAYYVRSIQKVNDDGSLTFFCAIDEGIVLTVARGVDLVENLTEAFEDVKRRIGEPELVIGCDCILRHIEVGQRGLGKAVAEILANNNVVGFSTYGEQFNAMHVNQTFTGVAIGSLREP